MRILAPLKAQGDSPIRGSVAPVSPCRQRLAINEIQHKITSLIKTRRVFVLFCDLVVLFVKANFVDGSVVLQNLKAGHGWMWTCEGRRDGWDCQRGRLRRVGKNPYDRLSSVGGRDVSASPVHPGIAFTRNHSDRHLYPDLGILSSPWAQTPIPR